MMGYLAETIATLRLAQPLNLAGPSPTLWREDTMTEWLVAAPSSFAEQRRLMVDAIGLRLQSLETRLAPGGLSRALSAMAKVRRERFICPWVEDLAYLPMGIDIGLDQIISHPEIVAVFAAAADPQGGRVLDVGTGSGYQAAVLAMMAQHVTSIEILDGHARMARQRLAELGYGNVEVLTGDAAAADILVPEMFDAIVVAAGARTVPAEFLGALKTGGRLVMPLGPSQDEEYVVLVEKLSPTAIQQTELHRVRAVPLTGRSGRIAALI